MPNLFQEFAQSEVDEWKELTKKELKGADIHTLPLWKESDGFSVLPAYFRLETEKLPMYGQTIRPLRFNQKNNGWLTCVNVTTEDVKEANAELLRKIDFGASAVTIDLNCRDFARDEINTLLKDVHFDKIAISFCNAANPLRFQVDFFAWLEKKGIDKASLKGGFWFDELNADLALAMLEDDHHHAFGSLGISGGSFEKDGANIPQQLGAILAWGNEIVNGLRKQGISFEQISNNLGFSLGIGPSFLPELAKFRLIRFLWARIMQQHGAATKRWKTWIHAQTGERHLRSSDTPVNLLRENAQAMSAILGSVDSLTLDPFRKDEPELAERMAIGTQHIMREEARLDRVIDPSAGSYYVEHLTEIIGEKAWDLFKRIEEEGGYSVCKSNGFLTDEFAKTDSAYNDEIEKLERIRIGANKFPSPFEESNDKVEGA